jgi:hypothetical protein
MAEMTPQVLEALEKALALSTHERGLLIDHLSENGGKEALSPLPGSVAGN